MPFPLVRSGANIDPDLQSLLGSAAQWSGRSFPDDMTWVRTTPVLVTLTSPTQGIVGAMTANAFEAMFAAGVNALVTGRVALLPTQASASVLPLGLAMS
jgi:hypothetical protein